MYIKRISFSLFILMLFFQFPKTAVACSCIAPGPPAEEFKQADAVLTGVVTSFTDAGEHERKATLSLIKVWKGDFKRLDEIRTGPHSAACGYDFQVGVSYVIYANEDDTGKFHTHFCTRTARVQDAAEDLAYLDELTPIYIGRDTGCCGGALSTGDAIVAGFFAGFLFWRRRK
ncbi:hypothetical protein MJD09_00405 [bacterium]|nr:hypothetical protein [bacterium]